MTMGMLGSNDPFVEHGPTSNLNESCFSLEDLCIHSLRVVKAICIVNLRSKWSHVVCHVT